MADPSQTGSNIAATLSLQQHAQAKQDNMGAGGFLSDVEQAVHMGKTAGGTLGLKLFNLEGVGDLFIPEGVLKGDVASQLANLAKRAGSPIVIGAEEAALKGANVAATSLEFKALASGVLEASSGISSAATKGGMSVGGYEGG